MLRTHKYIPTDLFTILEPPNASIIKFYIVQKRRTTDFEASKSWKGRSVRLVRIGSSPSFLRIESFGHIFCSIHILEAYTVFWAWHLYFLGISGHPEVFLPFCYKDRLYILTPSIKLFLQKANLCFIKEGFLKIYMVNVYYSPVNVPSLMDSMKYWMARSWLQPLIMSKRSLSSQFSHTLLHPGWWFPPAG